MHAESLVAEQLRSRFPKRVKIPRCYVNGATEAKCANVSQTGGRQTVAVGGRVAGAAAMESNRLKQLEAQPAVKAYETDSDVSSGVD
eukprot:SAG11_NODE_119_length_15911_cov_7.077599_3_plen_87_part_00